MNSLFFHSIQDIDLEISGFPKNVPLSHRNFSLDQKESHIWVQHNKTNNFRELLYGTKARFLDTI